MTLIEAARILGLTDASLRQAIARGSLRATKVGRDWRVSRTEVQRYGLNHRRWVFAKEAATRYWTSIHASAGHDHEPMDCPDIAQFRDEWAAAGLPE